MYNILQNISIIMTITTVADPPFIYYFPSITQAIKVITNNINHFLIYDISLTNKHSFF